ncbi:MAG: peroxide stress protein YaaA [Gammaproteobacteria bacterium]|nr:peroxide stress protein YaaA [Gammaproteobacteria bacterium]
MLILISPAKTLDFDTPAVVKTHSEPQFLEHSRELISVLRNQSPAEIASLMKISTQLADLNYARYGAFTEPFTPANAKQAVLAFRGDVYTGLEADSFSRRDFTFAQKHLRILSGLYGMLRPLDLIQPYRLEMGTRLATDRGRDLYAFWGDRLTATLAAELKGKRQPLLVNLASNEYFAAVDTEGLGARVVTPVFKDWSKGSYRFISFHAKKARGMMAGWIIRNRVTQADALPDFDVAGYRFHAEESQPDVPVFVRDEIVRDANVRDANVRDANFSTTES